MWYYKPFKIITDARVYYCVKEYYPRVPLPPEVTGKKKTVWAPTPMWSQEPEAPQGDTKKELIEVLEMMLEDIKHHRTKVIDLRTKKGEKK